MKNTLHFSTVAAIGAALMCSHAAFAQGGGDNGGGTGGTSTGTSGTQTEQRRDDDGPDLGWLGLLGLAGLAGLRRKQEHHQAQPVSMPLPPR